MTFAFLRAAYSLYVLVAFVLACGAVSDATFRKRSAAWPFLTRIFMAVLWPLAALSVHGRKVLKSNWKGIF